MKMAAGLASMCKDVVSGLVKAVNVVTGFDSVVKMLWVAGNMYGSDKYICRLA